MDLYKGSLNRPSFLTLPYALPAVLVFLIPAAHSRISSPPSLPGTECKRLWAQRNTHKLSYMDGWHLTDPASATRSENPSKSLAVQSFYLHRKTNGGVKGSSWGLLGLGAALSQSAET